jgi:DnaJ-class molecular chaperone
MPYIEVKTRIVCKCAGSFGVSPDPSCTLCNGAGWIDNWESLHTLLMDFDVQFEKGIDD